MGTITRTNANNLTSGVGKVLQVVSTTKTDTFTTTSSSFTDVTGASVTITPSSASNKIFVTAYTTIGGTTATISILFRVLRNGTAIGIGTGVSNRPSSSGGFFPPGTWGISGNGWHHLDTPSSTSALTYKIQVAAESGFTATVGRSGSDGDVTYTGRYPTMITVTEIAG
jgi:hypothetical protein